MWEKCPVCNGSGFDNTRSATSSTEKCPVCNGRRIINDLTGKPPKHDGEMCPHDQTKIRLC